MYLVVDCETTGLPRDWKAPVTKLSNWPRLVQLAWSCHDEAGNVLETGSHIVRPDGFTIPRAAQRIHGISTARAQADGRELATVLAEFAAAVERSAAVVAHNLDFDEKVVTAEYLRLRLEPPFKGRRRICTMRGATEFCRLPGPYGYKWPSLAELHQKLFGRSFSEAHDAAVDVAACARCFFELKTRGVF